MLLCWDGSGDKNVFFLCCKLLHKMVCWICFPPPFPHMEHIFCWICRSIFSCWYVDICHRHKCGETMSVATFFFLGGGGGVWLYVYCCRQLEKRNLDNLNFLSWVHPTDPHSCCSDSAFSFIFLLNSWKIIPQHALSVSGRGGGASMKHSSVWLKQIFSDFVIEEKVSGF